MALIETGLPFSGRPGYGGFAGRYLTKRQKELRAPKVPHEFTPCDRHSLVYAVGNHQGLRLLREKRQTSGLRNRLSAGSGPIPSGLALPAAQSWHSVAGLISRDWGRSQRRPGLLTRPSLSWCDGIQRSSWLSQKTWM
jgi:hypothetical protein